MVSTVEYYVPNGPSEGFHWLVVTVQDVISSDVDSLQVEVDDAYSCF